MDTVITTGQSAGALVAGTIVTFMVSTLKPLVPEGRATHLMFIGLSVVGALVNLAVDGQINHTSFNASNFLASLGIIMATANTIYRQFSEPAGIDKTLQKIAK